MLEPAMPLTGVSDGEDVVQRDDYVLKPCPLRRKYVSGRWTKA